MVLEFRRRIAWHTFGFGTNWNIDTNDTIRTLRLEWNPASDELQFMEQISASASTKREILSAISRLFDPLGLIGPVIATAKVLMQKIWKSKLDWNDPLPECFLKGWKEFQTSLQDVGILRIPRLIVSSLENNSISLHGFCDASENA